VIVNMLICCMSYVVVIYLLLVATLPTAMWQLGSHVKKERGRGVAHLKLCAIHCCSSLSSFIIVVCCLRRPPLRLTSVGSVCQPRLAFVGPPLRLAFVVFIVAFVAPPPSLLGVHWPHSLALVFDPLSRLETLIVGLCGVGLITMKDKIGHSSLGCHVADSDVAPGFMVRQVKMGNACFGLPGLALCL
jgi:hypothetical protein